MKTSISGKNLIKEMRDVAKEYFAEYGNPSCVCVGVVGIGKSEASGRARDSQERTVFVGISGATGRTLLRETLNADGHGGGTLTNAQVIADLTLMADTELNKYRSKKSGRAITQAENWTTHNCAESNMALYLLKNGRSFGKVTIASYQIDGGTISYKPLCKNCSQWVRQSFNVLDDFNSHT